MSEDRGAYLAAQLRHRAKIGAFGDDRGEHGHHHMAASRQPVAIAQHGPYAAQGDRYDWPPGEAGCAKCAEMERAEAGRASECALGKEQQSFISDRKSVV